MYGDKFPNSWYAMYASIKRLKHEDKEYELFLRDFIDTVKNDIRLKSRCIPSTNDFADFTGHDKLDLNNSVKTAFKDMVGKDL